ncbi:LOW QUALITY PROTEIN: hypothetical protein PHMEG_00016613 [Phytophthora megakarya]|uniref:Reverse transcriptase n=1 Tax=Phytophthora megakarya TaxID=4795 RepID=A0A225W028_9STRA|nr:LOW QUALITY PROTEIN: hypothetical protein PHMEG_00016613 [Phytophthora megakarya]
MCEPLKRRSSWPTPLSQPGCSTLSSVSATSPFCTSRGSISIYHDLVEDLNVLFTFSTELFNAETRGVFEAARDFGERLNNYSPWSSYEIVILAFCFYNVVGAYRLAVINDIRIGSKSRAAILSRFNMQDAELSGLLLKASRRSSDQSARCKDNKMSSQLLNRIPKLEGRQLCLRYVSVQGCTSRIKDNYLAHFDPPPLLTDVVNYGGIYLSDGYEKLKQNVNTLYTQSAIRPPHTVPTSNNVGSTPKCLLDHEMVKAVPLLVTQKGLGLAETIRLWRGPTEVSPSPNKALVHGHFTWLLHDYEHVEKLISIVSYAVRHEFRVDVQNHKSAFILHNALNRSVREGQRDGAYLVISQQAAARWNLHFSPFGCVKKSDANPAIEARVIHDLSFLLGSSTSLWSDHEIIPVLIHELIDAIACRIIAIRETNPVLKLKITSSRHTKTSMCTKTSCFVESIPDDVVFIDLALPFEWTGSAAHYGLFGKAITHRIRRESPNSLKSIEFDIGNQLEACGGALRLAMTAVLGPSAANTKRFTAWSTKQDDLGLEWDANAMTVSIPDRKITNTLLRLQAILVLPTMTRTDVAKLLGSLRHICSCIRPAKPFFQRLVTVWKRCQRVRSIKAIFSLILKSKR